MGIPLPEAMAEEPPGRRDVVEGVVSEKHRRRRPGGFFLRPDHAVRKSHPHPVGAVIKSLVADPVEDDSGPIAIPIAAKVKTSSAASAVVTHG